MSCENCGKDAVYKCSVCGKPLYTKHIKLRTICPSCIKETALQYTINKAMLKERRNSRVCSALLGRTGTINLRQKIYGCRTSCVRSKSKR